jgi:hypothetical protein
MTEAERIAWEEECCYEERAELLDEWQREVDDFWYMLDEVVW